MATPQEIQKLLEDIQKQYDRLGKTNPFKDFDTSNIRNVAATVEQLEAGLRDARDQVKEMNSDMSGLVNGFQSVVDSIRQQNSGLGASTKALSGMQSIAQKIYYDQQGISKLNIKQLNQAKAQFEQKKSDLKLSQKLLQIEINDLEAKKASGTLTAKEESDLAKKNQALRTVSEQLVDQLSYQKELEDRIEARIKQEERINATMGLGGAIIGSMEEALNKLGMGNLARQLGFDDAKDIMRETAEEIDGLGDQISALNTRNLSEAQIREGFGGKELKNLLERKKAMEGMGGKVEALRKSFSSMGTSLIKNLTDPLSIGLMIVGQLVNALGKVDKLTGETAKNLGMSYDQANAMVSDMTTIANLSGDTHVNTENLVKAQLELSKALGTNVMLNKELLVDFAKLTEQAGYSVETMTALGKITQSTGGDLSDNTAEILGTAKAFNAVNKLALNEKDIVAEVAKTGAATVLTFGRSADALAKNVMQAKQFGLNLQQAEAISSSLLNFQSSIESEMEAELLTGKQLNLEQARMLALQGKTGEAAAEVAKQFGTAEEFGKMNVIQQEALAKSVGMSRDELAQSLIEREALAKIGMEDLSTQQAYNKLKKQGLSDDEIAVKLGNETLANQMKSESVQNRFAAATQKLQEIFVSIAEPILAIVSPLMDLVTTVLPAINVLLQPIMFVFNTIASAIGAIKDNLEAAIPTFIAIDLFAVKQEKSLLRQLATKTQSLLLDKESIVQKTIGAAKTKITAAIESKGLLKGVASLAINAAKAVAGIPVVGPLLAAAAAAGAFALGKKYMAKGDDVMSPGYGKRILSAPEGTFALNDKDTVVAGTDLGQGSDQSSPAPTPSINLAPLVEQMSQMNSTLQAILAKEGTVTLDGTKVGTALTVANSKLQ